MFALTPMGRIMGRGDRSGVNTCPPRYPHPTVPVDAGVCPVLTAWAGRRLSQDLHTPLYRKCKGQRGGAGVRRTDPLGGDANHLCRHRHKRNCSETLKASGTALGWRHPTSTMW